MQCSSGALQHVHALCESFLITVHVVYKFLSYVVLRGMSREEKEQVLELSTSCSIVQIITEHRAS